MRAFDRIPSFARIKRRVQRWWTSQATIRSLSDASKFAPGTLLYRCNICGASCATLIENLQRDQGWCPKCDSSMRQRAVVHHLSMALFAKSLSVEDFPPEARHIAGLGMTDADQYAIPLSKRLRYRNTFYHREPRLDIRSIEDSETGAYDFIVSSDVLEHVAPPIVNAFTNLRRLLKSGGVLILTVPFVVEGDTIEHFPDLDEYQIEKKNSSYVLTNKTLDGRVQRFSNLVFHGGPGSTLEMRLFSESGLRRELQQAGFEQIVFHREPCFERGIYWSGPWSVPITAVVAPQVPTAPAAASAAIAAR